MNKINVLDHGFVRLVSYMQPAPENNLPNVGGHEDSPWTGDLEIVRNARVSYDADWRVGRDEGSDDRLVRRLHARGHTTPFEAMVFTFEVQAPIFVFRQWHRHRTWSYNELSARYAELPDVFYIPKPEHVGYQDKKEKQVRIISSADSDVNAARIAAVSDGYVWRLQRDCKAAYKQYQAFLEDGVPREVARAILPLNIYSRMFATVDLHNLFHFLKLRLDSHAQYEIRVYAEALLNLIQNVVPVAVAAFKTELMQQPLTPNEIRAVRRAVESEMELTADFLDDGDERETVDEDRAYIEFLKSALEKLDAKS